MSKEKTPPTASVDPVVMPVTLVTYDYDYGWIVEELNDGEYEMTYRRGYGHTERARRMAFRDGCELAAQRGGKCRHYYEWPSSVSRKHRKYQKLRLPA